MEGIEGRLVVAQRWIILFLGKEAIRYFSMWYQEAEIVDDILMYFPSQLLSLSKWILASEK